MNTPLELWSVPWHALQRSLAEGRYCVAARPLAGIAAPTKRRAAPSGSWLARAHALANTPRAHAR